MSQETMEWLNRYVLIGNTDQRGKAWHWRKGTDNHFTGPVPVETVRERLFNWTPVKVTPKYDWTNTAPDDDCATCIGMGTACGEHIITVERRADDSAFIIRSDNGDKLGAHSDGFNIHGYDEWLIRNAESIMGQGLEIGQAGLLRNGAQAWVSFEFPDTLEYKPKGAHGPAVAYRPQLMATTSLDGSIATTYKFVWTVVVCDNTRNAALGEKGETYRVKHTRHSSVKIADARQALDIVFKMDDEFKAELDQLMTTNVNSRQWDAFKALYVPAPDKDKETPRALTMMNNKRDALNELYETNEMCAPWAGTAYGVIQTVNTYQQHVAAVRKVGRVERNAENVVTDKLDDFDRTTWKTLHKVLVSA